MKETRGELKKDNKVLSDNMNARFSEQEKRFNKLTNDFRQQKLC